MNVLDLSNYLGNLIQEEIDMSVMIWGPPGIGKSSIVAQVAKDAKIDVIDLRLSQLSPTDFRCQSGTEMAMASPVGFPLNFSQELVRAFCSLTN